MQSASDYRSAARAALRGRWTPAVITTLVYLFITVAVMLCAQLPLEPESSAAALAQFLAALLLMPMGYGLVVFFVRHTHGEAASAGALFAGYRDFGRVFLTLLLQQVYLLLWTLLLIVPGLVKSYAYRLTPYVLHDHPELSRNAAIERSMQLMDGRKWKLFCLDLSFLGWVILAALTLGIGLLWFVPYQQTALVRFYEDARSECAA